MLPSKVMMFESVSNPENHDLDLRIMGMMESANIVLTRGNEDAEKVFNIQT